MSIALVAVELKPGLFIAPGGFRRDDFGNQRRVDAEVGATQQMLQSRLILNGTNKFNLTRLIRLISEDILARGACREQFKHVFDADSQAT